MRTLTLALITSSLLALPACNNGGGEDSTATTGGSTSSTTVDPATTTNTTPATTTTPGDTTTAGTATGSGSDSDPVTESGDPTSESATTEPATTEPATTEPVDTTSTTEPVNTTSTSEPSDTEGTTAGTTTGEPPAPCAMLGPKQCMDNEACMPLGGGKLNLEKMCVQKPMFLGCVDAGACGDALTYACEGDVNPPVPYLFPSTCLPDGWAVCDAPDIDMPCN